MIRRLIAQIFQPSFMPFIGVGGMRAGYEVEKSLRLRSAANGWLSRAVTTTSNRTTWTWSAWVKRSVGATGEVSLFGAGTSDGNNHTTIRLTLSSNDTIDFVTVNGGVTSSRKVSTALLRDPSSWYHIVCVHDTTSAVAEDRFRIYVNGVRLTSFSTNTNPALNSVGMVNFNYGGTGHRIGRSVYVTEAFDGYVSEINFVDGQALPPDSFGSVEPTTGQWVPKRYSGAYGVNGFYLDFKDGASLATLGQDKSGNGNDWTLNNVSLTSGATYDWMSDTPSNNFSVINPLVYGNPANAYSWGNLRLSLGDASNGRIAVGSMGMTTGKWYFEAVMVNVSGNAQDVGIIGNLNGINLANVSVGYYPTGYSYGRVTTTNPSSSFKRNNGSISYLSLPVPQPGDVIGVAFDADVGQLAILLNGASQGVIFSGIPPGTYHFAVAAALQAWDVNFGQRPFSYAPPTGFKAQNSKNLNAPLIANPKTQFKPVLYTGTGTYPHSVTGVGFQPAWTWLKCRNVVRGHVLFDKSRNSPFGWLTTDQTVAEQLNTANANLLSLDPDGFSFGPTTQDDAVNAVGQYVSWNWRADLPKSSNANGSIVSEHVVNPLAGFSIVTWTGNGAATATVGHGLISPPEFIIIKNRTVPSDWTILTSVSGGMQYGYLNTSAAFAPASQPFPTSSVFQVVNGVSAGNSNGHDFIAYCFSSVEGFSKLGMYSGNGNANGPFIHCGFRPAYVLIKCISTTQTWFIHDSARTPYNQANRNVLYANDPSAEVVDAYPVDFLSNGFKIRNTGGGYNGNAVPYLFIAFAEAPFKHANAR